jgi:GTP-dependent phosphoenolpyruvate carboxykinase
VTEHDVLKRKISELKARMRGQFGASIFRYTENAVDELELRNEALEEECQRLRAALRESISTSVELFEAISSGMPEELQAKIHQLVEQWKAVQP